MSEDAKRRRRLAVLGALFALLMIGILLNILGDGETKDRSATQSRDHYEGAEADDVAELESSAKPSGGTRAGSDDASQVHRTTVRGIVTLGGEPVDHATVLHRSRYAGIPVVSTRTDPDGRFELRIPTASAYPLRASCTDAYADLRPSHAEVSAGPITIALATLRYERVAFYDPTGAAVSVAGRLPVAAMARNPVFAMPYNLAAYRYDALPIHLRVDDVGDHEFVCITTRGNEETHRIDLQGYRPLDLRPTLFSSRRWPHAQRVVLLPDPSEEPSVAHRVVFPDSEPVRQWKNDENHGRLLEIVAGATTTGDSTTTLWVTQAHPVFRLPRGSPFEFKVLAELEPRPFRLRDEGKRVLVLVDWPRYAFLDLHIPARHPREPDAVASVSAWSEHTSLLGGRSVSPGHVRFAYLPEGRYMVEVTWWRFGARMPFASWRSLVPLHLAAGLNKFELDANAFKESTPR